MENIHLISLNNSLIPEIHSKNVHLWEEFNFVRLKSIKKPFLIVSNFDKVKDKKEDLAKLKDLSLFKGLILQSEPALHTISGSYLLKGLNKKIIDKIHTVRKEVITRIIHAWQIGAQKDLIAEFEVTSDGQLYVMSCDFNFFKCNHKEFRSLTNLSEKDLINYQIDKFGRYIEWPMKDIHLDVYSFKSKVDEKYKKELLLENLKHFKDLGKRMELFRKKQKKSQKEFSLSDRQIRRFEAGTAFPSYKALEKIALEYNLKLDEYVGKLYEVSL